MANRRRTFQVAEKIRNSIALELNRVADPRFHMVTITSVVVSPDLRHAKIYWVVTGGKERIDEVKEAFQSAEKLFRRTIGHDLSVRYTPELKFFYDDTLDTCEEVERLMERVHQNEEQ